MAIPKGEWKTGETFPVHNGPTRYWENSIRTDVGCVATSRGTTREEAEEIARLIAAAPYLRAALSAYVSLCGNTAFMVDREGLMRAYEMATAALAKIKGAGEHA